MFCVRVRVCVLCACSFCVCFSIRLFLRVCVRRPTALVTATLYTYGGPFTMPISAGLIWGLVLPTMYAAISFFKFVLPV